MAASDTLDQLFHDCTELESLVASILEGAGSLGPAVDSGLLTAEHLMNLTYRIEAAERGLDSVTREIGETASAVTQRRFHQAAA
jgi:hypothetical protein